MELSKDNIVSRHFSKKFMGGLDEFEVRDFLHVLAEEIRHLKQKSALQSRKIQDLQELVKDYRDREHILRESIASAEKWAEKIRADAKNNSALILKKAQHKSEALIQDARHSLQTVYNDIADLKRIQLQFKTGLKAALQVQMELLEQDPIFSPSSSLPTESIENFLADKNSTKKEERQSFKQTSPPEKPAPADKKESLSNSPNTSADLPSDKEMLSLRKSLQSLDSDFSSVDPV